MIDNFEKVLTKTILNYVPKNEKPLICLMNILGIGRESTYRRIRGSIPFTFEEIVKLSRELNFSIDELVGKNIAINGNLYEPHHEEQRSPELSFYAIHVNYYNTLQSMVNAENVEVLISLNRFFSFFLVKFDTLFRLYYFLWLHQLGGNWTNYRFSDVQLSLEITAIQQKIKNKISSLRNTTFIFDRCILLKLIQDIQYYYVRKLISDEELQEIKKDIIRFIDYIERYIQVGGADGVCSNNQFYLSLLNIDMNCLYGTVDDKVISQSWTYGNNLQNIEKNDLIASHKNWIHSLKRSSILISQSNEIAQASFLNEQRKNIEMITNDLFLYYG